MMQSEFLARQKRAFDRKRVDKIMNAIGLATAAFAIGLALGHHVSKPSFDLNKCDYLYPREALERVPENWKEVDQTPEGNWCVIVNH